MSRSLLDQRVTFGLPSQYNQDIKCLEVAVTPKITGTVEVLAMTTIAKVTKLHYQNNLHVKLPYSCSSDVLPWLFALALSIQLYTVQMQGHFVYRQL